MAVIKTRWSFPIVKQEEKVKPVAPKEEKKIPVVKEVIEEEHIIPEITEETTVEEIIATLPKKQRARKTVVKTEE